MRRIMKLLFLVYFIFQIETSVDAQIKDFKKKNVNPKTLSSQKIAALKIGDQIPIVILDNLINYSSKKVKLSDFDNKKLLIIDFWNTRCIACIEAFPKLMSLQKEFKEKLQILLVSDESISTVQAFLKKRHQLADLLMTLPIVCSDKILQKLFKHESCPHCVWIDELGVVKYITYSFDVGKKNITAVLNNEPVAMSLKDDYDEVPYDPVKPLFIKSYAGDGEQLLWYTALSRNI
ncbi:MAG TPA: TlpA disulfide reductase family protein, partial [Chitinophagaceae bacterium]|nr:TlpA disulfide reductase family protein [Chitinophagaceae bacterium]